MTKLILHIPFILISWVFFNGCAGSNSQIDLNGTWGGEGIGLFVSDSSTTIEYDCAHGRIDEPIITDANGTFEVSGVHVFEHGGALKIDETPDEHIALYKGRINGDEMILILVITDVNDKADTLSLTRGVNPVIHKCL